MLKKHGNKADYWILLADISTTAAKQLAMDHPKIAAILLMGKSYQLGKPKQVNNAVILRSIERGRYLGRLQLLFDAGGKLSSYKPGFINLNVDIKDDEKMAEKIEKISKELKTKKTESD